MARTSKPSPGRVGQVIGIVASLTGLAFSELVAQFNKSWHNPIISIGNRIIDHVPNFVKELVIRTVGVNDKTFLLFSIFIIVLILSAIAGRRFAFGNKKSGSAIIIAMSSIAAIASLFDAKANIFSLLPTISAGFITIFVMQKHAAKSEYSDLIGTDLSKRETLKFVGLVSIFALAATGFGRVLRDQASVQIQRIKVVLPKPLKFLPKPKLDPATEIPGLSALITPNSQFYRIDTSLSIPNISLDTWRLTIDGMVATPREFTYKELTSRPVFELDDTIACVSNEIGGNLVGNARWLGIRLDDLIQEVMPTAKADQVMGYSVDGFSAGFPLAALDGRDAMIAIGMNGESLPAKHGFPARIIVPGLYGYVSATKWLSRIELTRFDTKQGYWIPRGWSAQGPIKTSSRIDTPKNGWRIESGKNVIAGVAWAPTRGISRVEVRVEGAKWMDAILGPELANTTWRQWWLEWNAEPGNQAISVRATDGMGETQSEKEVSVSPNGAEGWHTITVSVTR